VYSVFTTEIEINQSKALYFIYGGVLLQIAKQKAMVNGITYVLIYGWRLVSPEWKIQWCFQVTTIDIQMVVTLNLQIEMVVFANGNEISDMWHPIKK
jgi:hypothetical protein